MEFKDYYYPVDYEKFKCADWANNKYTLGTLIQKNNEKIKPEKSSIIIIGIEEDRNASITGSANSPDLIRKHLYNLNRISPKLKIIDLGNLKIGKSVNDTYFALRDISEYIINNNQILVVLGGSQDLTFGMTKAFEGHKYNLVTVDPKLDFRKGAKTVNSDNYLNLIFEKQKNLHTFTTLAYQNYLVDSSEIDLYNAFRWDLKRLGQIRYDMTTVEPILRNADIFSFDINSMRCIDAPAQEISSPNGLYSEEACQISRYAGTSDKLRLAGFFNLLAEKDANGSSSSLMAQIVWHFIEGCYNRKTEDPTSDSDDFNQFMIDMAEINITLVFFQSRISGRWWIEISDFENRGSQITVIPCDEEDYKTATLGEIPDRWWKNVRKLTGKQNK